MLDFAILDDLLLNALASGGAYTVGSFVLPSVTGSAAVPLAVGGLVVGGMRSDTIPVG